MKSPNHKKWHQTPPHNPRRGQGIYVPLKEHVEKPLMKFPQTHPLCACNLDNQKPKSLEKSQNMKEYDKKGDPDEHTRLIDECLN